MKKKLSSLLFILLGSGLWFSLSATARFSIKRWDAKFESIVRNSLHGLGYENKDILSSLHEIKTDPEGNWVRHQLKLKLDDPKKLKKLKRTLKRSGAQIEEVRTSNQHRLLIKRGGRIYQEIQFVK